MIKLERLSTKPVLEPKKEDDWQRSAVFNAAAIYFRGLIHILYRATDLPPHEKYGAYISRIGYAVSTDGINFFRFDKPVMEAVCEQERRGIEDPRIVRIGDTFYMTYTGFGNRFEGDYRIMIAKSRNLITWERIGIALDEPNKDAALFPNKIEGRYVMFHRRYPNMWLAFSEDLKNWTDHVEVVKIRPNTWESSRVGVAGPPIEHRYGYIVIYHAADHLNVYRLGILLLDKKDPTKILSRQDEPILEPELDWEINGYIPNVVFSCGHVQLGDDLLVYYGGADTVIGVARLNLREIKFE
ncbi:glycosidase [Caldicellulosiruptor acetigenus]|uniref:glycoside hydrolase family 130 protein n=1 Tax=Caldicellulosiruptor acetigenus TaxID=301953 RepID=UPI00040CA89A|nr:glycosidase [Caldicellulosiruptor acetigenus]WAM35948.1 glycosidase [Caldicellulosiruptor acetigenus]